jgi:hypothetical protein
VGFFAGKIKKPKNDQFAGDFEKNSLVAVASPLALHGDVALTSEKHRLRSVCRQKIAALIAYARV